MKTVKILCSVFIGLSILLTAAAHSCAEDQYPLTNGQTIYVPAYSHIYIGNKERPFYLAVTLSIRNIDPYHSIKIKKVNYHETDGFKLHNYVKSEIILQPMQSTRYIVSENDKAGGSGANFIVVWEADALVNNPIVESIMIGTSKGQGISFTSRGRVISTAPAQ